MNQTPASTFGQGSSTARPADAGRTGLNSSSKPQELNFTDNPEVDMRGQIIKRCVEWSPPIDYLEIKTLMLPATVTDKSQWLLYGRRFEAYLRSHPYAHRFWKLGKYLLPAFIVMNNGVGGVSTNRALVGEFIEAMNDVNQSVLTSMNMNMKCQLVKEHPLYEMLVNNNSVTNVNLMIEFYIKMMQFIMDVLRHTVGSNQVALNVLAAYDLDNVESLFKMATELDAIFAGTCTAENRRRRYRFGNLFIGDVKCRSVDEFIAILYEERRWIHSIWNDDYRNDTEMLEALINGLSKSEKYTSIYTYLTIQNRPGQIVNFENVVESMRSYIRQNEFMESDREGRTNTGVVNSNTRIRKNNSPFKNNNNNKNMKSATEYFLPPHLRNKFINFTCDVCGIKGHKSFHHQPSKIQGGQFSSSPSRPAHYGNEVNTPQKSNNTVNTANLLENLTRRMMFIESNLNNNNISNNNHHANLAMVKYSPKTNTSKKGKYCSMCKKTTHNTSECKKNKTSNNSSHSANVIFSDNNVESNNNTSEIAQCYNNDIIVDY